MYSTLTRDFVELTLRFLRNLSFIYVSPLLNWVTRSPNYVFLRKTGPVLTPSPLLGGFS